MILPEPIEGPGYFWLPNDTATKLPGTLRISRAGTSTLHLTRLLQSRLAPSETPHFGAPYFSSNRAHHKRIVGIVNTNGFKNIVTLNDCYYRSWNMPSGIGVSTCEIVANTVLVGAGYEDDEQVSFSEFRFSFPGLDEWLGESGIDIIDKTTDSGHFQGVTINYTMPKNKSYRLRNGMRLEFNFDSHIPFGVALAETKITQKAYISIKSDRLFPFDEFRSVAWKVKNFLSFCADTALAFDSTVGYLYELTEEVNPNNSRRVPITIYFETAPRVDRETRVDPLEMLLSYSDIENEFADTINCWLDKYDECQPIFDSYFYSKHNPNSSSVESAFLLISQAVESFHRRMNSGPIVPDEEYRQLVNCMLGAIPEAKRGIFKNKLRFGNEPSFATRLNEMFSPFSHLYEFKTTRESYNWQVVNTRNFLTHYDKELESSSASGLELVFLQESLEALMQLHFLKMIGIEKRCIERIVERSARLRQKLIVFEDD